MKGLVQTHLGKRDEGLELVKKGVRLDLTSHIVWHVFGLIQKGEKNYEEALKSYTQALRFDKVRRASCYLPQKFPSQRSHLCLPCSQIDIRACRYHEMRNSGIRPTCIYITWISP